MNRVNNIINFLFKYSIIIYIGINNLILRLIIDRFFLVKYGKNFNPSIYIYTSDNDLKIITKVNIIASTNPVVL